MATEGWTMEPLRKSRPLRLLLVLLVVGAGAFAVWRYAWQPDRATYDIQTVDLSTGSIERSISATGSVQALVTVSVSSQLSGQISELNADFNSKVAKDTSLAVIDPRTFAARVASAEANLAIAKTTVTVQEATIVKAQALLDQAQRGVERQKALAATNATPQATLETAETLVETAKADLQVADAQLANAKATIAQREADLAQAKLDLDRTQIRSPIDGVVIARNIDLGATVAASLQAPILFQIAQDLKQIQILVLVDEADIGSIGTGQDVTFTVDAFPDRVFSGKVSQVRIAGTTTNNVVTYTVVVSAENPQQKLLPGMTATVRIITGTRAERLAHSQRSRALLAAEGRQESRRGRAPKSRRRNRCDPVGEAGAEPRADREIPRRDVGDPPALAGARATKHRKPGDDIEETSTRSSAAP